ncbi:MAG: hypothetical protein JSR21_11155 [Proteobacteria bacterium]|nr:hypothetical protein [Pseudomonadota bacterium]
MRALRASALALFLGACGSLLPAPVGAPVGQFGKAVSDVSAAQLGLYDALARNESDLNSYNSFVGPALAGGPRPVPLPAATMTEAQRALRKSILDGLSAYGQALQALAQTGDATAFDASAKSIDGSLRKIAGDKALVGDFLASAKATTIGVDAFSTAIAAVGDYVVQLVETRTITQTAARMQQPIEIVTQVLLSENDAIGAVLDGIHDAGDSLRRLALLSIKSDPRGSRGGTLVGEWVLDQEFAKRFARPDIAALQAALRALPPANKAVANAQAPDGIAAIQEFVARVQAVQGFYKGLGG